MGSSDGSRDQLRGLTIDSYESILCPDYPRLKAVTKHSMIPTGIHVHGVICRACNSRCNQREGRAEFGRVRLS